MKYTLHISSIKYLRILFIYQLRQKRKLSSQHKHDIDIENKSKLYKKNYQFRH